MPWITEQLKAMDHLPGAGNQSARRNMAPCQGPQIDKPRSFRVLSRTSISVKF